MRVIEKGFHYLANAAHALGAVVTAPFHLAANVTRNYILGNSLSTSGSSHRTVGEELARGDQGESFLYGALGAKGL